MWRGAVSIVAEPDIATLNLGVSVEKETVAEAREAAAIAMTAVLDSLKANDIAEEDTQTENFSIHPQYDRTDNGRVLRGYRVNNTISARVRELQSLSNIIDDATGAGGDIIVVDSIQFMIGDPTTLQIQARALAVKDAEAKAQTLADAHGVKLGKPVTITEGRSRRISRLAQADSAVTVDYLRTSTPIEAGELTVTVNITVVYEFE